MMPQLTWEQITERFHDPEKAAVLFEMFKAVLHTLRLKTDDPLQLQALARIEKIIHDSATNIPEPEFTDLPHAPAKE